MQIMVKGILYDLNYPISEILPHLFTNKRIDELFNIIYVSDGELKEMTAVDRDTAIRTVGAIQNYNSEQLEVIDMIPLLEEAP